MKIKTALAKIAKAIKKTLIFTLALIICALALSQLVQIGIYTAMPTIRFIVNPYEDVLAAMPDTKVIERKAEAEPTNPDAWVAWRIAKAGLNPLEAAVVQVNESGYANNDNRFNVNTNGSVDLGRWQWNTLHVKSGFITIECAGNFKCATEKAIEARLKDGSWSVKWYGARKAGL